MNDLYIKAKAPSTGGDWVRPTDWLPIPTIASGEQVFYGLCMVYQDRANLVSLRFTGNYTVDWGDGVIENFASNVVAHHQYNWASVGNVTSEGFRQALIKVTPQVGHNLTAINLQFKHPLMGGGYIKSGIFIDMVMNLPQLSVGSSIVLGGGAAIRHSFTERVNIISIGGVTSLQNLCFNFFKLQKFEIGDTIGVTNTSSIFYNCYALQSVPLFNTSNVTNMSNMFRNCYSLQTVPLFNTSNVVNMVYMFYFCLTLQTVPLFNTSNVTIMSGVFNGCHTLQTVPLFNTVNVTTMADMLRGCYTLQTVPSFNTVNVVRMERMFQDCYALQSVPLFNTSNVTHMEAMLYACQIFRSLNLDLSSVNTPLTNTFTNTESIEHLILNGCRYGFDVKNNDLSTTALNDMFTSLGTANGTQIITVTGNPGASTCDPTIATAKGFIVTL